MRVTDVAVFVVEVPQIPPVAPYRSHVRTSSTTQSAIVRVDTDAGLTGWGEHNINFLPDLSARRMQAEARSWLLGSDPQNLAQFHQQCPLETRLKSGIELALWDICGKAAGLPVAALLGGILRPRIELAACMGIQTYERAGEIAAFYVEQGFSTLKTKAGSDMNEDLEMVRGIRDAVGDKLKLRIDPNRAYSPQQAAELARRLEPYNLQYFEQPIPAEPLSDAAWLRRQTKTPIALNESVIGSGQRARHPAGRCRGVHSAGYAHRRRHFALRHHRADLRGGRHSLHHALRPRSGAQDGRHAARRRRLPRLFAGQRQHVLTAWKTTSSPSG